MQSKQRRNRAALLTMNLLPQVASRTVFEAHQSKSFWAEFALEKLDDVSVANTIDQWPVSKSSCFTWQTRFVVVLDGLDDAKLPWGASTLHEFDLAMISIELLSHFESVLQLHAFLGGTERQRIDVVVSRHVGCDVGLMIVRRKLIRRL